MVRNLIWPLGSTHIFTLSGWLILFIPDHLSEQHKLKKVSKHFLFLRTSSFRTDIMTVRSLEEQQQQHHHHHEESHLIYGSLASIFLDPVEYELDEFNTPHTGTTLSPLQLWLCRQRWKYRSDSQPLHPWATFSGDIQASPENNQNHKLMGDYIIPDLNQQTQLLLHL